MGGGETQTEVTGGGGGGETQTEVTVSRERTHRRLWVNIPQRNRSIENMPGGNKPEIYRLA